MIGTTEVRARISSTSTSPPRRRAERGARRGQAVRLDDVDIVELLDDRGQHPPGAGLIVDDEDLHETVSVYPRSARAGGISIPKIVLPSSRRTPMFHPKPRTSRCVTASPRPMLPCLPLTNGSKIAVAISSAIPG